MTVQQQTPFNQYTGNGVTTVFAYQFRVLAKTDLTVSIDGAVKIVDIDYTVSGVNVGTGGSVTFFAAPPNASTVNILRTMRRERLADYQQAGDFLTPTVNPDFDRAILLIQDLNALLGRAITAPVTELTAAMGLPSKAVRANKYVHFNTNGDVEVADFVANVAALSKSIIGQFLYPQTALEIAAGIVPTNYAIPSHEATGAFDLRRYGAAETYSAVIDDLQFWNKAIAVAGANGGKLTGACRKYQINGTLDINSPVTPDFGTHNDGGQTTGFMLFSNTNAPILRFNTVGSATFTHWSNFTVLGTRGGGLAAQDGIVVNNMGMKLSNFNVRNCGGSGFKGTKSYAGLYTNGYITLCENRGVLINGQWGANNWFNVNCVSNDGDGWHVLAADGRDFLVGCNAEQNLGVAIRIGVNVMGWEALQFYSERNVGGSAIFEAGSDENHINFRIWSSSTAEADPVNSGGSQNVWTGHKYLGGTIRPKLLKQTTSTVSGVVTAVVNAIPYDDTPPQSVGEGGTIFTVSHDSVATKGGNPANKIKGRAWCSATASAGNVLIMAVFKTGAADAIAVCVGKLTPGDPVNLYVEFEDVPGANTAYTVKLGSDSNATITVNGTGGARKFGGSARSGVCIEEFMP